MPKHPLINNIADALGLCDWVNRDGFDHLFLTFESGSRPRVYVKNKTGVVAKFQLHNPNEGGDAIAKKVLNALGLSDSKVTRLTIKAGVDEFISVEASMIAIGDPEDKLCAELRSCQLMYT